jgi:pyridoxamine 5'-phosphate oxidase
MPRRPELPTLSRADLDPDPIAQFRAWFAEARAHAPLAEAIALATVDDAGLPDARMVLLKGIDDDGFRFFTNYNSVKAAQLGASPAAALIAYWRELDRQVRVRGSVERLSAADSDAYFATRPRESQLGAWASPQSQPIESREQLERNLAGANERFDGVDVERPPHWGGFLLRPATVEFWQGQIGRLHDRFRYARDGDGWRIGRLAP